MSASISYNNQTGEIILTTSMSVSNINIGFTDGTGYLSETFQNETFKAISPYTNSSSLTVSTASSTSKYTALIVFYKYYTFSNQPICTITNNTNWITSSSKIPVSVYGETIYMQFISSPVATSPLPSPCTNPCFSGVNCNILSNTCELVCNTAMTKCPSGTLRNQADGKCYNTPCNTSSAFTTLMNTQVNGVNVYDPSEKNNYLNYNWPSCDTLQKQYKYVINPSTNKEISVQDCPTGQMRFSQYETGILNGTTQSGDGNCYPQCPSYMTGFPDCKQIQSGYMLYNDGNVHQTCSPVSNTYNPPKGTNVVPYGCYPQCGTGLSWPQCTTVLPGYTQINGTIYPNCSTNQYMNMNGQCNTSCTYYSS